MENKYGLIVIGAGPGGYVAAAEAAKHGIKTAVIEKSRPGGTCLNRGCIPTKTFVHAVNVMEEIKTCQKLGLSVGEVSYDINALYDRKDEVVKQLQSGILSLFKKIKIDYIEGSAKILSAGKIEVASGMGEAEEFDVGAPCIAIKTYECDNIIIATGSEPIVPELPGTGLPGVITSDDVLGKRCEVFDKLIIIGGGVIATELATIYAALGTKVTIIEALDRIIATMDKEISQSLSMSLKKKGVSIVTGASVREIEKTVGGLTCLFEEKGEKKTAEADAVLIAVGRAARTKDIVSDDLDLKIEHGKIPVDENQMTCIPGIYAIGDVVKDSIQLAHVASAQGVNAVHAILGKTLPVDLSLVPSCLYTTPEVAAVGMTADEAKAAGIAVKSGKALTLANGKTLIEMGDRGFVKIVADADSGVILGAQMMCGRATDMIGEISLAIEHKLTLSDMKKVIKAHPSYNEMILDAIDAALAK